MDFFQLLEERTWQSLKERYLKVIRKAIRDKTDTYGLDSDQTERLSL